MKLNKGLAAVLAFGLFMLLGLLKTHAQDNPTPSPETSASTEPAEATPGVDKKLSVKDQLSKLEEQNQQLESRLKSVEEQINGSGGMSAGESESTATVLDSPFYEPGSKAGIHQTFIPMDAGNEYLYDESRVLTFSNKSGSAVFRIGGHVFTDMDFYFQPDTQYLLGNVPPAAPAQSEYNGFELRKASLDFRGEFDKFVGFAVGLGSESKTGEYPDFYHGYLYVEFDKALVFRAGKFSNVISLEADQPSADLPFMEPSMVADLISDKDYGASLSGTFHHFADYAFEIYNGEQDNESDDKVLPSDPAIQNYKALAARVFFTPWMKSDIEPLKGLGFGIAGGLDNEVNGDQAVWAKIETSFGENNTFATLNSAVVPRGDFYHWDPQFYYYYGPFGLQGEMVQSIQTVGEAGDPSIQITNTAWNLYATWVFGGKAGFAGPKIDNDFDLSKGTFGAVELVVRAQQLQLDNNLFAQGPGFPFTPTGQPFITDGAELATGLGIGVNWWFDYHFKTMFDFENTSFGGGTYSVGTQKQILPEQIFFMRAALII